jgi:hypothetical protein
MACNGTALLFFLFYVAKIRSVNYLARCTQETWLVHVFLNKSGGYVPEEALRLATLRLYLELGFRAAVLNLFC